jgi:hypothetical protein
VARRFDAQQAIDRRDGVNGTATTSVARAARARPGGGGANRGWMGRPSG